MARASHEDIPTATKMAMQVELRTTAQYNTLPHGTLTRLATKVRNEDVLDAVAGVDIQLRRTIRSTAHHALISKSTLNRRLQEVVLDLKPALTPEHMSSRVAFCLSNVIQNDASPSVFREFDDFIHVDEKWF
ncbi:hypothetical protein H257_17368 [Aphanomyces astaci]|uniref:Transposase Tc1-like domain-containing protein n=1 Tax=Aphanomyces astaci TaxID=112090 RepID=W4FEX5_APHAT|nr:hypothetical protein H257_17368 [Aphanomyces astaci]ETV66020.1 hypothetical protein H257_17368 [Aphanomyces astaci]|eukprot:XP_009844449.1 hypothetical protein H257_17368 [Aphanomyces astaci]